MRNFLMLLFAFLLWNASVSPAKARLYDPTSDGQCHTMDVARDAWPTHHIKYRPKRDGTKCWHAGVPLKAKAKLVKKVKRKPVRPSPPVPVLRFPLPWSGATPPGMDADLYGFYETIFGPETALRLDFETRWRRMQQ
jgi:hypothetical protein